MPEKYLDTIIAVKRYSNVVSIIFIGNNFCKSSHSSSSRLGIRH